MLNYNVSVCLNAIYFYLIGCLPDTVIGCLVAWLYVNG